MEQLLLQEGKRKLPLGEAKPQCVCEAITSLTFRWKMATDPYSKALVVGFLLTWSSPFRRQLLEYVHSNSPSQNAVTAMEMSQWTNPEWPELTNYTADYISHRSHPTEHESYMLLV